MRIACKLFLLTTAALTMLALTASAASAGAGVEVHNEPTGTHCSNVVLAGHTVTGGCHLAAQSEGQTVTIAAHTGTSETIILACAYGFEARINEEGSGYIYNQNITPEGGSCFVEPCDESAHATNPHSNIPWTLKTAELFPNSEALALMFCIRPHVSSPDEEGAAGFNCQITIDTTDPTPHAYDLRATNVPCRGIPSRELTGHWTLTSGDIEIEHL